MVVDGTVGYRGGSPGETEPDELLRNADLAMYAGKRQGKARCVMYDETMYQALADRLELEADLRGAIERGEICARLPADRRGRHGRMTAVEALARWSHPTRGAVAPVGLHPARRGDRA